MIAASGSEQAFAFLRKLIYDNSAIVLEADKRYLLEARLGPMLTREHLGSFDELVARLNSGNAGSLRQRVLEAVTTHETSFFRDLHPFEMFRKTVIPRLAPGMLMEAVSPWITTCPSEMHMVILTSPMAGRIILTHWPRLFTLTQTSPMKHPRDSMRILRLPRPRFKPE